MIMQMPIRDYSVTVLVVVLKVMVVLEVGMVVLAKRGVDMRPLKVHMLVLMIMPVVVVMSMLVLMLVSMLMLVLVLRFLSVFMVVLMCVGGIVNM